MREVWSELSKMNLTSNLIRVELFKRKKCYQTSKVIGKIFSTLINNDVIKRVFPLIENLWSDERNCLSMKIMKSNLCVKLNYNMSCQGFSQFS